MPVKGISDRPRQLPRLGKIHLGIKVQGDKSSYPKATDFFVCPAEVQAVFGPQPKALDIAFPVDDVDVCASVWYRCYSSYRGLTAKGDGETCTRLVDLEKAANPQTGLLPESKEPKFWPIARKDAKKTDRVQIQCIPDHCEEYGRKQCRMIMNLQFLLPNVEGVGVWQVDTSSIHSIRNLLDGLDLIKRLGRGRMALIPLKLSLIAKEVEVEGVKKTIHVLQVVAPQKIAELIQIAALPAGRALLPEPDLEAPEGLVPEDVQDGQPVVEETPGRPVIIDSTSRLAPASPPVAGPPPVAPAGQPADWDADFALTPQEQKERLWLEVQRLCRETGARPEKVQLWFKRNNAPFLTLTELKSDSPPMLLSLDILTQLRDNLESFKAKMAKKD